MTRKKNKCQEKSHTYTCIVSLDKTQIVLYIPYIDYSYTYFVSNQEEALNNNDDGISKLHIHVLLLYLRCVDISLRAFHNIVLILSYVFIV